MKFLNFIVLVCTCYGQLVSFETEKPKSSDVIQLDAVAIQTDTFCRWEKSGNFDAKDKIFSYYTDVPLKLYFKELNMYTVDGDCTDVDFIQIYTGTSESLQFFKGYCGVGFFEGENMLIELPKNEFVTFHVRSENEYQFCMQKVSNVGNSGETENGKSNLVEVDSLVDGKSNNVNEAEILMDTDKYCFAGSTNVPYSDQIHTFKNPTPDKKMTYSFIELGMTPNGKSCYENEFAQVFSDDTTKSDSFHRGYCGSGEYGDKTFDAPNNEVFTIHTRSVQKVEFCVYIGGETTSSANGSFVSVQFLTASILVFLWMST